MPDLEDFEDPDFNAYLDEAFEALEITVEDLEEPLVYLPSRVLSQIDQTVYLSELTAWRGRRERGLKKLAHSLLANDIHPANADRFAMLAELVSQTRVIPFVGAGLSIPAGYPGWRDFLIQMAEETRIDREEVLSMLQEGDFERVATRIARDGGERRLTERISAKFIEPSLQPRGAIRLLPEIFPRSFVITTNFDNLISEAYAIKGKTFTSTFWGREDRPIFEALSSGEHHLFKLHGDARNASHRVLTSREYDETYGANRYEYERRIPSVLKRIFMHYPLLFLGCSLTRDRTLSLFHEIADQTIEGDSATHFALLEDPENDDDWRQRECFLTDCNIKPIWYPAGEHDYVEAALFQLATEVVG